MGVRSSLQHAWRLFWQKPPTPAAAYTSYIPGRARYLTSTSQKTTLNAVKLRLAVDAAAVPLHHVITDDQGRFKEYVKSGLEQCLNDSPNLDQTPSAFLIDLYLSLLEWGCVCVVPIASDDQGTPSDPTTEKYTELRIGRITEWMPKHVRVEVYDVEDGRTKPVLVSKELVAIIENPLYAIMNETSGTFQRLLEKYRLLDEQDDKLAGGKLDLLIQLPYTIRSQVRRDQAQIRQKEIEDQLQNSQLGIGYIDGAEKVVQLNRPAESNLVAQTEKLLEKLYSELGVTAEILNGTASAEAMANYRERLIKPLLRAVQQEMQRKFLRKTARNHGHAILYFVDLLTSVTLSSLAAAADQLCRNTILSPNDFRGALGLPPSQDPDADRLRNRNMPEESPALLGGQNGA